MDSKPAPLDAEPLTFERAEYEAPPPSEVTCTLCGQRVVHEFFRCNAQPLCAACAAQLKSRGLPTVPGAFGRAFGLGLGAAILGAALWFGIRALTGYDLGIVGVVVGWFVGAAVRRGAGARGGWLYQTLAIVLVYLAIASTYVPEIMHEFAKPTAENAGEPMPALVGFVIACVLALITPFFTGFFGIIILGIAVYEAWKLNQRPDLVVEGPLPLATLTPAAPAQIAAANIPVPDVPNA